MTTEQEVIDLFFPDDNTKTINDVISKLTTIQNDSGWTDCTDTISQVALKTGFPDISDWSF